MNSVELEVMLLTERLHPPLLLMVRSISFNEPRQTSPKLPALAIALVIADDGAFPETATVVGDEGALLVIVMLPDFAPLLVGWNRTGILAEPPGLMTRGKAMPAGIMNSAELEEMLLIERLHPPLLLIVKSMSLNEPGHIFPKLPLSEMNVAIFCCIPSPCASITMLGWPISLL
jgi:hypothetical protein